MSTPSIQELIREYIACQQIHQGTDYSNKASVRAGNRASDRMRSIANEFSGSQNFCREFEGLLDSPNQPLARWAAHHLLELMRPNTQIEAKAIQIIQYAATGDGADAYGEQLWLKAWQANHPPTPLPQS